MGARKSTIRKPTRGGQARLLLQKQETARVKRLLDQARQAPEMTELESELVNQLDAAQSRMAELERALAEREAAGSDGGRLAELEARVAEFAAQEKALQEQRATMAKLQQEAQAWMMGEREAHLGAAQRELAAAQSELASAREQLAGLEGERAEHRSALEMEREASHQARAARLSLEEQLRTMENDLGNVQTELVSAQERLAELDRELADLPGRLRQEAREQLDLEKQPLIEQQAVLMATLAEESGKRRELEEALARATDVSAELERMRPLQTERDEALAGLEKSRSEVARLEKRIGELEAELVEVEKRGQAALEREMEANDRVMLKMEEALVARDKRIAELGG